jgi:hypothetical protein
LGILVAQNHYFGIEQVAFQKAEGVTDPGIGCLIRNLYARPALTLHSSLGRQMIAWLIKNRDRPKPFSHLLVSTSFSKTSVRHLLNQFVVLGLVEITKARSTCRRGDIIATPKVRERLEEYAELIAAIISRHSGVDLNPLQSEPSQKYF